MIDILKNLLKCKSLWSLTAMAMFIYLVVSKGISGEIAMSVVTMIVTYFFTKKEDPEKTENKENYE